MSLPAVGKHLRVLENAGLIERTISGRVHRCALNASPLRSAGVWLENYQQFCGETFDAPSEYVQSDGTKDKNSRKKTDLTRTKSAAKLQSLHMQRLIPASPERVFRAWTDPDEL